MLGFDFSCVCVYRSHVFIDFFILAFFELCWMLIILGLLYNTCFILLLKCHLFLPVFYFQFKNRNIFTRPMFKCDFASFIF